MVKAYWTLKKYLKIIKLKPNATFIPEIWQGHKDEGKGFKIAFNKLNNILKMIKVDWP